LKALRDRSSYATAFSVNVLPNGDFKASGQAYSVGLTAMGSGQAPFEAWGKWSLIKEKSGLSFILKGKKTTPFGINEDFGFASTLRDRNTMAGGSQNATHKFATSCRR